MIENNSYDWIYKLQQSPTVSSVTIKANPRWASLVTNRVRPYKSMPEKFRPALEAAADYYVKNAIPRVFKQEGPGWRPLSKRTQRERKASGYNPFHPILQRTGDLYKELTEKSHPKHIEIVKVGKNARITIGGSSEKFIRNQLGNSALNIPARPMIPGTGWIKLDPVDDLNLRTIITQKIQEAMRQDAGV